MVLCLCPCVNVCGRMGGGGGGGGGGEDIGANTRKAHMGIECTSS